MKDSQNTRAALATGVCLVLALVSGCSTGEAGGPTDRPSSQAGTATAQPSSAPTQEPAPTPSAAPVAVGDVLPAEPEQLPEGIAAFEMPDGSYVAVGRNDPLPQAVLDVANAELAGRIQPAGDPEASTTDRKQNMEAAQSYATLLEMQTGKQVVVFMRVVGGCPWSEEAYLGWFHTTVANGSDGFKCLVLPSLEEAQARVADVIAAQPNPGEYATLVIEN